MAHSTKKQKSSVIELTITEYCNRYDITRNAVFRRLSSLPNNNILSSRMVGPRLILLTVDKSIKFIRRKRNAGTN